jgi:hypothetical protein
MDFHLDNEAEAGAANHRQGPSVKTLLTPKGTLNMTYTGNRHSRLTQHLPARQLRQ